MLPLFPGASLSRNRWSEIPGAGHDKWHGLIGDPTIADAILDRLVHNAHRLNLKGDSMRKIAAAKTALDGQNET
jgi:hypothetical protein